MSAGGRGQHLSSLEVALLPSLPTLASMAFLICLHYQVSSQTLLLGSPHIGQAIVPESEQGGLISSDLGATLSLPHSGFHPCGLAPWEPPNTQATAGNASPQGTWCSVPAQPPAPTRVLNPGRAEVGAALGAGMGEVGERKELAGLQTFPVYPGGII